MNQWRALLVVPRTRQVDVNAWSMNLFGNYSFAFIFVAIAVMQFIRRRPDTYWLWIILMGGGIGALIYIAAEVVPDLGLLRHSFQIFSHRKRIAQVEVMVWQITQTSTLADAVQLGAFFWQSMEKFERRCNVSPRVCAAEKLRA